MRRTVCSLISGVGIFLIVVGSCDVGYSSGCPQGPVRCGGGCGPANAPCAHVADTCTGTNCDCYDSAAAQRPTCNCRRPVSA